jgi:hypothetical protein
VRWLWLVSALWVACSSDGPDAPEEETDEAHASDAGDAAVAEPDAAHGPVFDAGSDPARNRVKPDAICARFAAIQCAGEQFCCERAKRATAECGSAMRGLCSELLHLDEVAAAPQVNFDLAQLGESLGELERRAALCDPAAAAWAFSPEGFAGSVRGTLGSDDDCTPDGGVAAPLDAVLIALMSCRTGNRLACLPGEAQWTCAPRASRAGRCFTDLNCQDGLYCENPSAGFDGQCTPRKAAEGKCAAANECTSFICKTGRCAADDDVQAAYCTQ